MCLLLRAGKYADMILLDRDVLSVSPEEMQTAQVQWIMFEGRVVYDVSKTKSF